MKIFLRSLLKCFEKIEIYHVSCPGAFIGGRKKSRVTIANDDEFNKTLDNIMDLTQANLEDLKLYPSTWIEQIKVSSRQFHLQYSRGNLRRRFKSTAETWRRRPSVTT